MPKTDVSMREVFETHLPYELGRLVEMYELHLEPKRYRAGLACGTAKTLDDALIVAFCPHARNLLEFFYRTGDRAAAAHYANGYTPLDKCRDDVKALTKRLNAQISHLSYERTDKDNEKIQPKKRQGLVVLIRKEADRLRKDLKKEYHPKYLQIDLLDKAAAMGIPAAVKGTASIHVVPCGRLRCCAPTRPATAAPRHRRSAGPVTAPARAPRAATLPPRAEQ
jgi:hypothetical protein